MQQGECLAPVLGSRRQFPSVRLSFRTSYDTTTRQLEVRFSLDCRCLPSHTTECTYWADDTPAQCFLQRLTHTIVRRRYGLLTK